MAKLIDQCASGNSVENTGVECAKSLSTPVGIFLVPASAKWTKADMADPVAFFQGKIQETQSKRFFPIFADIYDFAPSNDSNVTENAPNGTTKLIRLGGYILLFTFSDGGECMAKKMLSFNKKGYRFIVVDNLNQFKVRKNSDGTYSGLKTTDLYAGAPTLATFTASYKNAITASISVDEYITNSEIFASDSDLSEFVGLLDVDVAGLGTPTTTKATVGATTECAGTNLYDDYADALAVAGAWKIADSTGAAVAITTVAKNDTLKGWDLTFATQAGKTLTISLASADALHALEPAFDGYEGATSATVVIPAS